MIILCVAMYVIVGLGMSLFAASTKATPPVAVFAGLIWPVVLVCLTLSAIFDNDR